MKPPKAGQRELPEEGAHNAVCIQVIDLGTQESRFNDVIKNVRKILVGFELPDLENEDGGPTIVSLQMSFTDSPKGNLMKTMKQWLGVKTGDFDMDDCLGKAAIITITHNTTDKGTFANITNVGQVTKGHKVRKPQSGLVSLYIDESFDAEVFEALPEWIRTKIASSPEYEDFGVPAKPSKASANKSAGKPVGKGKK